MTSKPSKGHASPARQLALQAIGEVRRRGAYARQAFDALAAKAQLSDEDRAFAALLTYGVVSCSGTLDAAIDNHLDAKSSLQPMVRDCLRIATYEMLFLRKSSYAAVDQGVELVKSVQQRAAGLANAVLRGISREAGAFPWDDPETDVAALARMHGYPEWLVKLVLSQRGRDETLLMLDATQAQSAPIFLGCNPFVSTTDQLLDILSKDGISATECGPAGCVLAGSGKHVVESKALSDGRCVVADASAQVVASLATPEGWGDFLEVGSGRGTKTVLLQANAKRKRGNAGRLFALDIYEFKTDINAKRMKEFKVPGVVAVTGDANDLASVKGLPLEFSGALIDAPCTGLGTLRRHPEQRWRVEPDDIGKLAEGGLRMLEEAARHIATNGFIVYSTCTVTREEDEDVIARFLESPAGEGFHVEDVGGELPEGFSQWATSEGYFRSMPQLGGADGHFAARLRKKALL